MICVNLVKGWGTAPHMFIICSIDCQEIDLRILPEGVAVRCLPVSFFMSCPLSLCMGACVCARIVFCIFRVCNVDL